MRRLALNLLTVLVMVGVSGVEANSAPYSQEVDNATEGRFEASEDWGTSSYGKGVYDENYRFARPTREANLAQFKIEIPETANYAVYARWPEVEGLNDAVPVGVETTSGLEWTKVNQQQDGGRWVRIGVYEMAAGDDYSVKFSQRTSGKDYVAADAVKVVRVHSKEANPSKPSVTGSDPVPSEEEAQKEDSTGPTGEDVVEEAKSWSGVRYRLGRVSHSGIDCSGLTMQVYKKFGISLPHDVVKQSRYGSRVSGPLKPGDLVFFDEHGDGISHIGIATGHGTIIHASDYWRKVTETQIKYIKGLKGARRLL